MLAAEQMQALPYATQLLARLGVEVVKVEHPTHGESGRGAAPAMIDPQGRPVGSTYLRNNLDKRSVGLDLSPPTARRCSRPSSPASTWWPRTSSPAPWPAWGWATRTWPSSSPR